MPPDCFICAKHRGEVPVPGGLIYADDLVVLSHLPLERPTERVERAYLGHLFLEPRRHIAELGELHPDEAARFGQLAARAGRAVLDGLNAEHVYAAVVGHHVAHLHCTCGLGIRKLPASTASTGWTSGPMPRWETSRPSKRPAPAFGRRWMADAVFR